MTTIDGSLPLADATPSRDFLGHPRGLAILFFTEMWERFSFYGMRALLVLYLTQHFLFGDAEAQGLYAAYAALVYLMPVIGGLIADRFLGARKAVTIGALLLVAGHFTMAFEGSGGRQVLNVAGQQYAIQVEGRDQDRKLFAVAGDQRVPISIGPAGLKVVAPENAEQTDNAVRATPFGTDLPTGSFSVTTVRDQGGETVLYLALALIIIGVGFLKPNISTVVGALYAQGDSRRDAGFTIFYVGINLGSVMATALCGWLGIAYGWRYGFGLAGFGMLLGLVTFLLGQRLLEGKAMPPDPERLKRPVLGVPLEAGIYILGLLAVIPAWLIIQQQELVEGALSWLAPLIFLAMLIYSTVALKGADRSRMLVALILTIFSVLFWTLFEQAGSSLTLFAERSTELPSWFNAAQTNTFNPGLIVLLGPLLAMVWVQLGRRNADPPTPYKFAMALVFVGLGFLLLVFAARTQAGPDFRVPLIWLFLTYLFHTIGELFLSPVGLSMITKLSVARVVGLMMGVWFLASALAHSLAGQIAKLTSADTVGGVVVDPEAALNTYAAVFNQIGWAAVIVGGLLLLLSPVLKKMMAGVK